MALISKHTTDEESSPFYLANKAICEDYENFIEELNGQVRGVYNAFSFQVLAKVKGKTNWTFELKKSTFSSGNLLLSSKAQSILEVALWSSDDLTQNLPKFTIRKSHWTDWIKNKFNSDIFKLHGFKGYRILSTPSETDGVERIVTNFSFGIGTRTGVSDSRERPSVNHRTQKYRSS